MSDVMSGATNVLNIALNAAQNYANQNAAYETAVMNRKMQQETAMDELSANLALSQAERQINSPAQQVAQLLRAGLQVENVTPHEYRAPSVNYQAPVMQTPVFSFDTQALMQNVQEFNKLKETQRLNSATIKNMEELLKLQQQGNEFSQKLAIFEYLKDWLKFNKGLEHQTSEREASQAYQTSEREASQAYQTSEREAVQSYNEYQEPLGMEVRDIERGVIKSTKSAKKKVMKFLESLFSDSK